MSVLAEFQTPPAVAKSWHVSRDTVLGWIKSGELVAVNLAKPGSKRPRYRIDPADLQAFLLRRRVNATPKVKRRKKRDPAVKEFF